MKRDSRFELLRIISMFMIIIFHFDYFGQQWRLNSIHSFPDYICLSSYLVLGKLGVYLFIMITGYFVGNKMFSITKSLIKGFNIWLETFYYSLCIFIVLCLTKLVPYSFNQLIKNALPFLNDQYWFVDAYLILLLLIPFINIVLNQLTRSQFFYLILIISFLASALAPIKSIIFSSELQFGYVLPPYLIGAYIKRFKLQIRFARIKLLFLYILTVIVAAIFYQIGKTNYINIFFFGIPQLLMATLIFVEVVTQGKPYVNRFINGIAKTVFASYLITDNLLVKVLLWNIPFFHNAQISLLKMNLIGALIVLGMIVICSIIDYVRIILFKALKLDNVFKICLSKMRRSNVWGE